MLFPLRPGELQRLIPAVATGNQFRATLGTPQEILQRLMIFADVTQLSLSVFRQFEKTLHQQQVVP